MKFKRLLAFGLVVLMSVSILSACGNNTEEENTSQQGENEAEEPGGDEEPGEQETTEIVFPLEETVSFTGMAVMNQGYKLSETLAWQTMNELTNVDIELTGEFQSAEAQEKMTLILNSGEYPDMIIKYMGLDAYELGQQGIVIPLEDLIREYAPSLTAILDERDLWDDLRQADGEIYYLPQAQGVATRPSSPAWINKRWMENLGLQEPKNLEELYQVLKAFKEQDANGNGDPDDEIPLTFSATKFTPVHLINYMEEGLFYYDNYCGILDEGGEFVYYPLTDGFKDNYLAYLKKLYDEGILDKEAFTQSYDQMIVKGKAADVYGMFFQSLTTGQVAEEYAMDYITLKPWSEGHLPLQNLASGAMMITDKCENPEILIAWADYFYTEEGAILADMGVEGETYKMNEDGTYSWIVDGTYGETQDEVKRSQCLQGTTGFPMIFPELRWNVSPETDPVNAWIYKERDQTLYKMGTVLPNLKYTDEEQEIINQYSTQVGSYIETYTAQAVTGQVDLESSYSEFQATLREMGAEELFAVYQAAYERAVAE